VLQKITLINYMDCKEYPTCSIPIKVNTDVNPPTILRDLILDVVSIKDFQNKETLITLFQNAHKTVCVDCGQLE